MPSKNPNDSDFEEAVKLFASKINLDLYCVKCELETFVAHLLPKEPNNLSIRKAATFAHQWRELFPLTNTLYLWLRMTEHLVD